MRRIFEVIETYHMIEPGMCVVVGVSGGADSVCLLYVLKEYSRRVPFELTVVHVEHGLRGEESLEDARFTRELCHQMQVPFRLVHAQVQTLAAQEGLSTEEAGRKERYRIFREVQKQCGAQRIAVAHNRNDQAETVLHHLVRGSGLKGLGGIAPVRDDIIRPLLFTTRAEIEEILRQAGLSWRTDRTNLEQDYTRNRIRLSILPHMERELNVRASEHIAQAGEKLQQVQSYIERETCRAAERCISSEEGDVCIALEPFLKEDELIRSEVLRRALSMCGGLRDVGTVHIEDLMKLAGMDCGKKLSLPGRITAVRENGILRFQQLQADVLKKNAGESCVTGSAAAHAEESGDAAGVETKKLTISGKTEKISDKKWSVLSETRELRIEGAGHYEMEDFTVEVGILENCAALYPEIIRENQYTKWLSYDTIKGNIMLRTRRTGDYLVVGKQGGRKKLKDYLIDCKVPQAKRDQIWLLADGSHVLWVVGYRISEAAKVTEETGKVMKIRWEEKCR
jgi:tRNA(Ile)-lysidine synthase